MGKKNILVIIDMQNDFITGSLANPAAEAIVPKIVNEMKKRKYTHIYMTADTHGYDYLRTQEGKRLPIVHCVDGTFGHKIRKEISKSFWRKRRLSGKGIYFKHTFGCTDLEPDIRYVFRSFVEGFTPPDRGYEPRSTITLVGTCTDICVITNALLLKTYFPEAKIKVIADLCAGTTKENHEAALTVMRQCQIDVI